MTKRLVKCPCGKEHWANVTKEKNPLTGKTVKFVMEIDKLCQNCKNRERQSGMKRKARIRAIPEMGRPELILRSLYIAEMERRRKEAEAEQSRNKLRKKK